MELRNVHTQSISITNCPSFRTELFDAQGKTVPQSGGGVTSGAVRDPQIVVIPADAYLGFRVDAQTLGSPAKDAVLLAVGGSWALKPGRYVLKTVLVVEEVKDTTKAEWFGEIALPAVELSVTNAQLKTD